MIRGVRSGGGYNMRQLNAGVWESGGLQLRGTGVWRDGDECSEPSPSLSLPQVSTLEHEAGRARVGVERGLCEFSGGRLEQVYRWEAQVSERWGDQVLGLEEGGPRWMWRGKGGPPVRMKGGGWAQEDRGGAIHGFKVSSCSRALQEHSPQAKAFLLVIQRALLFTSFSQSEMSSMFCWKLDVSASNRFYSIQQNLLSAWLCCGCWRYKKQNKMYPRGLQCMPACPDGIWYSITDWIGLSDEQAVPRMPPTLPCLYTQPFQGKPPDHLYNLEMNKTNGNF